MSPQSPPDSSLLHPVLGYRHTLLGPAFSWCLGICIQAFMLAQQGLCPQSHLSSVFITKHYFEHSVWPAWGCWKSFRILLLISALTPISTVVSPGAYNAFLVTFVVSPTDPLRLVPGDPQTPNSMASDTQISCIP